MIIDNMSAVCGL